MPGNQGSTKTSERFMPTIWATPFQERPWNIMDLKRTCTHER